MSDNPHLVDGKYGIRDLVDLDELRRIFERFTAATGFPVGFLDHPGLNVLLASGWQDICTKFHRACPISEAVCVKSNRQLLDNLTVPGQLRTERCENGLVDCAFPIIIKGIHVASLATGQLLLGPPDWEKFRQQARVFGFDEQAYFAALAKVPVVDEAKLHNVTLLIGEMAQMLTRMGYERLIRKEHSRQLELANASRVKNAARHQLILQTAMDGYWVADSQGRLLEVNEAYCRMSGYRREELLALKVSDLEANETPVEVAARIQQIKAQRGIRFESRHRRKDGSIYDTEVSVQFRPDENEMVAFIRDITARKQAEIALQTSEALLRETQRIAGLGRYVLDLPTGCWSSSVVLDEIFGIAATYERTVAGWAALIHPDDRARMVNHFDNEVLVQHRFFDQEYRIVRVSDGSERWVHGCGELKFDAGGRPVQMLGTIQDITARKQAEQALVASEHRYRGLFEHMNEGVAYCRMIFENGQPQDWVYLSVNQEFETLTGLKNVVGRRVSEIIPGIRETDFKLFEIYGRVAATGVAEKFEIYFEALQMWFAIAVFRPEPGCFVAMFEVITARKQAEEENQRLNRTLQAISACNHALIHNTNEADLLNEICRIVTEVGGYRMAWIGYAVLDEAKHVEPVAHAGYEAGYMEKLQVTWSVATERGRGPTGTAIRTGQPCLARNLATEPSVNPWRAEMLQRGYASVLSVPIKVDGQVSGALNVYSHRVDAFDGPEMKLLAELAEDLAFGIQAQRARLQQVRAEENLRQSETKVRHLNNILRAIQEISHLLNREKSSRRLLAAVCRSLVKTRGYIAVWVGELVADSKRILPVAHAGADEELIQNLFITWDDSSTGNGPTGIAARECRTVVFDDITRDPRFAPWREPVMAIGGAAIAAIPILHGHRLFGVLTIKADHSYAFDPEEVALLNGLAADVARALHNLEEESARLQTEEANRRLATAVEQSAEAIVITDATGTIVYVNPAFEKSSGYTRAEALGKNPRFLKSGKHDAEFYRRMWETLLHGEMWTGHLSNKRKDGMIFEEEVSISPVRDDTGTVVNYVAVKLDVTAQWNLEAQLRQSQKMEAIGQLAGGVAHDFNNILAIIQLQAGLLKMDSSLSAEQSNHAHDIEVSCQRAANLVRQLLLFSRRQALQMRDLDLNEVVAGITKMLQRILGEHIQMQFKFAPTPLTIHADAGMLEQILVNLTVNARDAMPKGGQLVIETSAATFDADSATKVFQARPGAFACVSVTDTGGGIPPEILPKIFDPFFTTKEVGKGTGLGLATVFGIVQQHKGWVNVHSVVGQGTTLQVYLPRLRQLVEPAPVAAPPAPLRGGNETILLVEDELPVQALMQNTLQHLGYRVLSATTGPEALAVMEKHQDEIHLLLTDLTMPGGMTGMELSEELRRRSPKLKVVYASGYSEEMAGKKLRLIEGENYLAKPFEIRQLAQTVRNRLDKP